MSDTAFTPFLEFVPNQILKASDLNSMQEKISEAIKKSGISGGTGSSTLPNTVDIPTTVEWNTFNNTGVVFEVPYSSGITLYATKVSDLILNKEQLQKSIWYMNDSSSFETIREYKGSDAGILHEQEEFIIFQFDTRGRSTNAFISVSVAGAITVEVQGVSLTVEVPETGMYQVWGTETLPEGFMVKVAYSRNQEVEFTQGNQDQNDYTSPDFIKNRLAYSYNVPFKEEEIFNGTLDVINTGSYDKTETDPETGTSTTTTISYYSVDFYLNKTLELNKNYRIIFNGEEFLVKATGGQDMGLILGNAAISGNSSGFNPNIPFCIYSFDTIGSINLPSAQEQCSLKIYTTDIILPKNTYTITEDNALFIPGVYFVKNEYVSDPMGALDINNSYEITFKGIKYQFDLSPISMIDLVWGQGCGNSSLNDLISGNGIPFILASTESVMTEFFKLMENIPPEGIFAKMMESLIPLLYAQEFPTLLFAVGQTGTYEIEIREIPKINKVIPNKYLPKKQSDWNDNDKDSMSYIKNRPCYSYIGSPMGSSSDGTTISGTATKKNLPFRKLYGYGMEYNGSLSGITESLLEKKIYGSVILGDNQYIAELDFFAESIMLGNIDLIYKPLLGKKNSESNLPFLVQFNDSVIIIITKEDLGEELECQITLFPEKISPLHPKFLPTYELANVFTSDISLPNTTYSGNFDNDEAMFTGYSFESVLKKGLVSISFNFNDGTNTIPLTLYLTNVRYQNGNHYVTSIHIINDKLYAFYFNIFGSTIECSYKEIGGTV